jgi:hypothetical protein
VPNLILPLTAGLILLSLPGFAWLVWFWDPGPDPFERLGVAVGASLSLASLLALAAFLTGWRFNSAQLVLLLLLFALLLFAGVRRRWTRRAGKPGELPGNSQGLKAASGKSNWLRYLGMLLVFLGILFWRFYQVRELVLPAWVDSLHHVLIVRLILENGGLPVDLQPYLPVPFYYHYSFHAMAALQAWLARLHPEQAVLVLGQLLNACVALSVYRLGMALWQDWRRAFLAAALVGFGTQMPAYYASWGRYTLLTGLVLLPLAMAAALDLDRRGVTLPRLANLALLTAGVLLSHYFAAILLALFLILMAAKMVLDDRKQGLSLRSSRWLPLAAAVLAGGLVALPWLVRAWAYSRQVAEIGVIPPSSQAVDQHYFPEYAAYLWQLAGPRRNYLILVLASLGLLLAAWRRQTRLFALWSFLLVLMSLPWGLYIAPFRPDHTVIVLFLPAALLLSDLVISAVEWLLLWEHSLARAGGFIVVAGILALLIWGIWDTRSIVNASTVLATDSDLAGIRWIEDHTLPEARFFHNITHWLSGTYRGVDGGWWITPLTGRSTLLPVALYAAGDRDYILSVNRIAKRASQLKGCSSDFWDLMREQNLDYVYIIQGKGSVQPEDLESCPGLESIYHQDGVFIYRVID